MRKDQTFANQRPERALVHVLQNDAEVRVGGGTEAADNVGIGLATPEGEQLPHKCFDIGTTLELFDGYASASIERSIDGREGTLTDYLGAKRRRMDEVG